MSSAPNARPGRPTPVEAGDVTRAIRIPQDWTPAQALTVVDLLGDVVRAIWEVHGDAMVPLVITSLDEVPPPPDGEFGDEDDIPF